jgi:hypothetical protein
VFNDGRVVPVNPAAVAGALGPQTGSHEEVFSARTAVCQRKTEDLAFVADQLGRIDADPTSRFAGRLDTTRLGAVGHSFGGNAALEWCRSDPRCRAAVNLDGAIWTEVGNVGLERPALHVLAEHHEFAVSPDQAVTMGMAPDPEWFLAEKEVTFGGWRSLHTHARPGYTVRIAGATHMSFMDVPFLPQLDGAAVGPMLAATTIDAGRCGASPAISYSPSSPGTSTAPPQACSTVPIHSTPRWHSDQPEPTHLTRVAQPATNDTLTRPWVWPPRKPGRLTHPRPPDDNTPMRSVRVPRRPRASFGAVVMASVSARWTTGGVLDTLRGTINPSRHRERRGRYPTRRRTSVQC